MISGYYKIFRETSPVNSSFILLSILLSVPAILLGDWNIFIIPLILLGALCFIYGENFLIALILLTLFVLVADISELLRSVVHLVDFTLLGFLFLKKYGLDFHNYPKVPRPIIYFVILYFFVMLVSSAMSSYPLAALGIIARQFVFFIIVYVFYSYIKDISQIKIYFFSIIIVSCILTTASLTYFYYNGFNFIDIISLNRTRISAIISNFEAASNFYVIVFPILISMLLIRKTYYSKKVIWLVLLFISLGVILNMSRSSIIGIIISTAIIFFILRRKLFYKFLVIMTFLSLIFIFYEPLNQMVTLFLRLEEGMSTRDYIWPMSLNIIKDYPLFGVGPGVYKYEMFNYFPFMLDNWYGKLYIYFYEVTGGANLSHNIFLVFFTEMGILGFITIITLPIIFLIIGIKTINKYRDQSEATYFLIIALFAGGTSIIVRNFFNSIGLLYVGGIYTDLPFWLILGSLTYFYLLPTSAKLSSNKKLN